MKKIFLILILFFFFGTSFPTLSHAQNNPGSTDSGVVTPNDTTTTSTNTTPTNEEVDPGDCISFTSFDMGVCVYKFLHAAVYQPTSWIARISGQFLDFFVFYSLQSDAYGKSPFVEQGWGIVRDISNLLFIFLLLWSGISTITGLGNFDAKKAVANIIIVAILINFSLFISKAIIDVGNVTARVLYNSIEVTIKDDKGEIVKSSTGETQISASLVAQFDPQKLLYVQGSNDFDSTVGIVVVLIASAVNIIMMYAFLAVSFVFIGRIAGLWLAMIFSPLALMSFALPASLKSKLGKYGWDGWLENITTLSFMAPVFVFFMYLILMLANIKNIFSVSSENDLIMKMIGILIPFSIIIVLILEAKTRAIKMSGEIGQMINKYAGVAVGAAAGVATGGLAMAGRATVGKWAGEMAQSQKVKDWAAKNPTVGKLALKTFDTASKSNMDLRKTAVGNFAKDKTGMNFDNKFASGAVKVATLGKWDTSVKAGDGGYKGQKEKAEKEILEFAKKLKTSFKTDKEVEDYYAKRADNFYKNNKDYQKEKDAEALQASISGKEFKEKDFREEYEKNQQKKYDDKLKEAKDLAMSEAIKNDTKFDAKKFEEEFRKSNPQSDVPPPVYTSVSAANKGIQKEYGQAIKKRAENAVPISTAFGGAVGAAAGGVAGAAVGAAVGGISENYSISRQGELSAADKLISGKPNNEEDKATQELEKIDKVLHEIKLEFQRSLKERGEDIKIEDIKDEKLKEALFEKRASRTLDLESQKTKIEKLTKTYNDEQDEENKKEIRKDLLNEKIAKERMEDDIKSYKDLIQKRERAAKTLENAKKATSSAGDKK